MTTSIVSPASRRKAELLAEQLTTFSRGRSKQTGQQFYVVPASNRMTAHWTAIDGSGCTCQGYQRRGICTHQIAARSVHDRSQPAPAAPKRASYADLFPACPCGDVADSRDGLCDRCASDRAWDARRASQQTARATEAWL